MRFEVWVLINGVEQIDLSAHVLAPIFIEEKLDETLDTGQITLAVTDIAEVLEPKSKIRIKRLNGDAVDRSWDFVVDSDQVEKHVGVDKYTHRIHLIEPSVIAQGMHVDNISLTRQLNDVSLQYTVTSVINENVSLEVKNDEQTKSGVRPTGKGVTFGKIHKDADDAYIITHDIDVFTPTTATVYYGNYFSYEWYNLDSLNSLKEKYDGDSAETISFNVPMCACNLGNTEVFGELETTTKLYRTKLENGIATGSRALVKTHNFKPTSSPQEIPGVSVRLGSNNFTFYKVLNMPEYEMSMQPLNIVQYSGDEALHDVSGAEIQIKAELVGDYVTGWYDTALEIGGGDGVTFSYTVPALTQAEKNNNVTYSYEVEVSLTKSNRLLTQTEKKIEYSSKTKRAGSLESASRKRITSLVADTFAPHAYVKTKFTNPPFTKTSETVPYTKKPKPYNAYTLLRKAIMSVDTYLVNNEVCSLSDIELPIKVDNYWKGRLEQAQVHETVFEQKNLWEVMIQVGYYLHAIPKLRFSEGSETLTLYFRQLGETAEAEDSSNKITVFNSKNLSEYFTQFDSYVNNFYSPQNIVTEYLVPKTTGNNYLVSNETAELHTSYGILEVLKFEGGGTRLSSANSDITEYIYESTVYNTLPSQSGVKPSKAMALTYSLGDTKITGFSFTPPSVNPGEALTSFKAILKDKSGVSENQVIGEKANNYRFRITYRTQDALRVQQFKPSLEKHLRNLEGEQYPHNEQFFGQQDKIVDSERFTANLFGQLLRLSNEVYQRDEQVTPFGEKQVGDLVRINNEPYYVASIENELYTATTLQRVSYSKDYNQMSQVVTIPSEPRFYEISERSSIRREKRENDFIILTTSPAVAGAPRFMSDWKKVVRNLILGEAEMQHPTFALTKFSVDKQRKDLNPKEISELFPSSEIVKITTDGIVSYEPKPSKAEKEVLVPVLKFPLKNAILYTWEMRDNFSAGDSVEDIEYTANRTADEAYRAMLPVRYCDVFGGADFYEFQLVRLQSIYEDILWFEREIREMPHKPEYLQNRLDSEVLFKSPDGFKIALNKDNREALSFNYQINLLYDDEFVTFGNLFGDKLSELKAMGLKKEINKFGNDIDIRYDDKVELTYTIVDAGSAVKLNFSGDSSEIKSIVLYEESDNGNIPYIARNVGDTNKLKSWYFSGRFN